MHKYKYVCLHESVCDSDFGHHDLPVCMHAYTDTHACTRTNAHTYTLRSFLLNKLHSKEKDIVLPQAGVRPESRRVRAILELVLH